MGFYPQRNTVRHKGNRKVFEQNHAHLTEIDKTY